MMMTLVIVTCVEGLAKIVKIKNYFQKIGVIDVKIIIRVIIKTRR